MSGQNGGTIAQLLRSPARVQHGAQQRQSMSNVGARKEEIAPQDTAAKRQSLPTSASSNRCLAPTTPPTPAHLC